MISVSLAYRGWFSLCVTQHAAGFTSSSWLTTFRHDGRFARVVIPKVSGEDGRGVDLDGLQTAVNLADDGDFLGRLVDGHLGGEGALSTAH